MKRILFILIILVLISGCTSTNIPLSNCNHDEDCKIDETCAAYGDEFEVHYDRCTKLNCDPLYDGSPRFLAICNEGQPPAWIDHGVTREYLGEGHTCLSEESIKELKVCRKVRDDEIDNEN